MKTEILLMMFELKEYISDCIRNTLHRYYSDEESVEAIAIQEDATAETIVKHLVKEGLLKDTVSTGDLLGEEHSGMRVSMSGMLSGVENNKCPGEGHAEMIRQMHEHLEEAAERFYDGDPTGCDEFFQLFCLDENRPVDE